MKIYNYSDYLQSAKWKWKRDLVLQRSKVCEICGNGEYIQVHHKRYWNKKGNTLGRERIQDLAVLCGSCHKLWHNTYSHDIHMSNRIIRNIKSLLKIGGRKRDAFLVCTDDKVVIEILKKYKREIGNSEYFAAD